MSTSPALAVGPIIILTYAHAGDVVLSRALSENKAVATTHGTGLLPLCFSAVSTWQNLENRAAAPSAFAVKSIRRLVNSMAIVLGSSTGSNRWCETAYAGVAPAEAFIRVFPEAKFLCLHRSLSGVFGEGLRAYPWGLGDSPFWQQPSPIPGNNVATISAYWVVRTGQLLEFEDRNPQCSIKVRYEDLVNDGRRVQGLIYNFLGLEAACEPSPPDPYYNAAKKTGFGPVEAEGGFTTAELAQQLDRLPDWLRARVAELHARLGYTPLL